jgi:serine/threonine protein kinase
MATNQQLLTAYLPPPVIKGRFRIPVNTSKEVQQKVVQSWTRNKQEFKRLVEQKGLHNAFYDKFPFSPYQEIGRGGFGAVYKPGFKCKGAPRYPAKKYVSKVSKQGALAEYQNYQLLKLMAIDRDMKYFIGDAEQCELQGAEQKIIKKIPIEIATSHILNYVDGGISLREVLRLPGLDYTAIFVKLENIFQGVALLHAHGIYHLDIKEDNIVFDQISMRLIDFGMSRTDEHPPTRLIGTLAYLPLEMHLIDKPDLNEKIFSLFIRTNFLNYLADVGIDFYESRVDFPTLEYYNGLQPEDKYRKADIWALGIILNHIADRCENKGVPDKLTPLCRRLLAIKLEDRPNSVEALRLYREFLQTI